MISLPPNTRLFLATTPTNLHFSFDRLAGLVRNQLRLDPLSGHLFLFYNVQRTHLKIFFFDRSGYVIYYRRLERGTFQIPPMPGEGSHLPMEPATLALMLEGIDLRAPRRRRFSTDDLKK